MFTDPGSSLPFCCCCCLQKEFTRCAQDWGISYQMQSVDRSLCPDGGEISVLLVSPVAVTLPHHSPSQRWCCKGRSLKEPITWHPQPRNRETGKLPSAWLFFSIWYGPRAPDQGMVPPGIKMDLPTSLSIVNIIPDSHVQRPISQVSVCAVKLRVSTNSHSDPCFRLMSFSFLSPLGLVLPNQRCEINLWTNQHEAEAVFYVKNSNQSSRAGQEVLCEPWAPGVLLYYHEDLFFILVKFQHCSWK